MDQTDYDRNWVAMVTLCAYPPPRAVDFPPADSEININVLSTPTGDIGVIWFAFGTQPCTECLADATICYCIEETL